MKKVQTGIQPLPLDQLPTLNASQRKPIMLKMRTRTTVTPKTAKITNSAVDNLVDGQILKGQ